MKNRNQQDGIVRRGRAASGARVLRTPQLPAGLLIVLMLATGRVCAQSSAAKAAPRSDRCLLIVETSRSMQRRANAVLETVEGLLKSGLNGQLEQGDTLGLWTFNESVQAGPVPLQTWWPQTLQDIALSALTFLRAQKYEKQARFDSVLPALRGVIKDSEGITVILISSGDDKIQGTPFDAKINEYYERWREQQQKARMPFVTILRAERGQLADYSVNTPPWPLRMPRRAAKTKSVAVAQADLPKAVSTNPPAAVPALIISGKKPQPEQAAAPKPAPLPAQPEAAPAVGVATATNAPVEAKPPEPNVQPVEAAKAEPAPAVPAVAATESAPKPVEPAQAKAETVSPPPATTPEPKPAVTEPPKPSPALQEKAATMPATVAAPERGLPVAANSTATQAAREVASVPAPATSPLRTPPVQDATAVPAESLALHLNIWIAGLVLAAIAAVTAFLLIRRSRATPQGSLITRSFEREKKP